jgi:hypothetical protein
MRSRQRDRETDTGRLTRLDGLLEAMRAEIERERNGLQARYESVSTRAAFSQQALENEPVFPLPPVIDELTETMIRYSARLAALEKQIDFVNGLRQQAALFPLENEGTEAPGQPDGQRSA